MLLDGIELLILAPGGNPEAALFFWAATGVPWWQSFLAFTIWTSFTIFLVYYGSGLITSWLRTLAKKTFVKKLIKWWNQQGRIKKGFLILAALLAVSAAITAYISARYFGEIPWLQVFGYTLVGVSASSILIYFLGRKIKRWETNFKQRTINRLSKQKNWVLPVFAFIPFLNFIPGWSMAIYIATRLLKVKHGLLYLVAGNALQAIFYTVLIYLGFRGISGFF